MDGVRWAFVVSVLAVAAYANTISNGFAYDDNAVIVQNELVRAGDWQGAASSRYHPQAREGSGLYRPLTSALFVLEWGWFEGSPLGYHVVNVVLHAGVTALLFFLLSLFVSALGAGFGAALFAVHPVHVEAVANVVGMAELLSGGFLIAACVLYLKGREWTGLLRGLRLVGLACLYLLSLGGKEIGVALPLVLLLFDRFRIRAVQKEAATYFLLGVVLVAYLGQRWTVLGTLSGEVPAPTMEALSSPERFLTAVGLWAQYARLLLFPVDLSADYAPGVLFPSEGVDLNFLLGLSVMGILAAMAVRAARAGRPWSLVALGIGWFGITVLPVSNLLFPAGVVLAERTLYLPSVGMAVAAAGLVHGMEARAGPRGSWLLVLGTLVLVGMVGRTIVRNPVWASTLTVLESLNRDHPESHLIFLNRGAGLEQAGDRVAAGEAYEMALRLVPHRYGTLTAVSGFLGRSGEWSRAEELARRAMDIAPERDDAYRLLANQFLLQERGPEAHRVALDGMALGGFHPDLWAAVSESYVLRGDLQAAIRARRAAVTNASDPRSHRARLMELESVVEAQRKPKE